MFAEIQSSGPGVDKKKRNVLSQFCILSVVYKEKRQAISNIREPCTLPDYEGKIFIYTKSIITY